MHDAASKTKIDELLFSHQPAPSAEEFLLTTFGSADLILLGEDHRLRHNLLLVRRLLPRLHAAGVRVLAMEFGAEEDQAALDALVTGDAYDPDEARRIMFSYNVGWAWVEYMDLYRAAWELNRSLPAGTERFRVLNMSYRYDWEGAETDDEETRKRVFYRGDTETFRFGVLKREVLDRGAKALVLTGDAHAFTRYRFKPTSRPLVEDGNEAPGPAPAWTTLGNLLHDAYGDRVRSIMLHAMFPGADPERPFASPAKGVLDGLARRGFRGGLDLLSGPAGDLEDDSGLALGYPGLRMRNIADGWIIERPFAEFESCTIDPEFVTAANFGEARRQHPDPWWHPRPESLEEYWAGIKAYADLSKTYGMMSMD